MFRYQVQVTWMEGFPNGQVGPSAPSRVVVELKFAKDLAPIHLLRETDRNARENLKRLVHVLKILAQYVSRDCKNIYISGF